MPATDFIETPPAQEMTREETAVFNAQLVDSMKSAGDGLFPKVAAQSTSFIRRRIRENVFTDDIISPVPVTDADLHPFEDTDLPGRIENMEPDSPGAMVLPFNSAPPKYLYRGDKFKIIFATISTPICTKNVDELRTYSVDLRQIITDNMLKDLGTIKDIRFIQAVEEIVGTVGGVGLSGVNQNTNITGGVRRASYAMLPNAIQDRSLNNGVFLMNRHTANEFLKWHHDEIGGPMAQELLKKGLKAMERFEIVGVPHLATIKREIVPDFVVYGFASEDYLGRHYVLMDTTMHVKKEIDTLEFHARGKYGISIPNVAA